MRLLFDQNISFRIVSKVIHLFPNSIHVNDAGLTGQLDRNIWEYARDNELAIVTFDSDFYDLSLVYGHPPKVVWLRTGNTTTNNLEKLLLIKREQLNDFFDDPESGCLEIME